MKVMIRFKIWQWKMKRKWNKKFTWGRKLIMKIEEGDYIEFAQVFKLNFQFVYENLILVYSYYWEKLLLLGFYLYEQIKCTLSQFQSKDLESLNSVSYYLCSLISCSIILSYSLRGCINGLTKKYRIEYVSAILNFKLKKWKWAVNYCLN